METQENKVAIIRCSPIGLGETPQNECVISTHPDPQTAKTEAERLARTDFAHSYIVGFVADVAAPHSLAMEFPDYPESDAPQLGERWSPTHWRNEPCPSWINESGQRLFADYVDVSKRDFDDAPRFSIHPSGALDRYEAFSSDHLEDCLAVGTWLETNDDRALLAHAENIGDDRAKAIGAYVAYMKRASERELERQGLVALIDGAIAEERAAPKPCPDLLDYLDDAKRRVGRANAPLAQLADELAFLQESAHD